MNTDRAATLLESALQDLHRGFTARAGTRMRQAAETGYPAAQLAYARMLFDVNKQTARRLASEWLEQAARQEFPEAVYARSASRYAGLGGSAKQETAALDDLNAAADAGYPPAETALAIAWQEHDNPDALSISRAWLSRAAGHGDLLARIVMRSERSSGKPASLGAPSPLEELAPAGRSHLRELHAKPFVGIDDQGLSAVECAWLRLNARATLRPSQVLDPDTGRPRPNLIRTGMTSYFPASRLEFPALRLAARLASYGKANLERAEPLAILRYRPGEQYKLHRDALGAPALAGDPLRNAGDRSTTILGYLNSPAAGGETDFPKLGIRISARAGRILVFDNLEDGDPAPLSLHAGLPVTSGMKWLASLWIRQRNLPG